MEGMENNMDTVFQLPKTTYIGGKDKALPLREILARLDKTYCGSIGAEFMHISNFDEVNWIRKKLETPDGLTLTHDEKRVLLARYGHQLNFNLLAFCHLGSSQKCVFFSKAQSMFESLVFNFVLGP